MSGIDNVKACANGKLTSWTAKSGADGHGRPSHGLNLLNYPVPVVVSEPKWSHERTAEREGIEVHAVIALGSMLNAIRTGDRCLCDHPQLAGKTLEITHRSYPSKPGLAAIVIFVKEIGSA